MLLLYQNLSSLEKQCILAQATNTHGDTCAYTYRGTGSTLDRSTLKIRMVRGLAVWLKQ
jgi:hypothetical protein